MGKMKLLCLHGSRQDSEIFYQRLRALTRKGGADIVSRQVFRSLA